MPTVEMMKVWVERVKARVEEGVKRKEVKVENEIYRELKVLLAEIDDMI